MITKLPEFITSLMMIANLEIDYNKRVSVMPSSAPSEPSLNRHYANYQFLGSHHL